MWTLAEINRMQKPEFVEAFGDVAEHSPWVAEEAHALGPFAVREDLITAFETAMRDASHGRQLDLIRAHPDLAGKAALAGEMAEDSKREQAGAGLDQLTAAEFARFTDLNNRYLRKFGFPFIFAVKGATKDMILAAFETRIENEMDQEFETALQQIARIFRFRLEDRVEG
ncbi:2-oxo-4-hydroxy-4-carboxy-5-ureidoimidazoline decarboxylase [Roseibium sp.]|uniref:2-oxo-4-hydroxy-4-carboxy-5-ureidoimidazoline decarboxylase n=1 Tax=Roseibium sp. TaxID=1936156 RepID=UPI003A9787EB